MNKITLFGLIMLLGIVADDAIVVGEKNNRSLERFYDAKYIDIRTGEVLKGAELHSGRTTRNKNLNSENLRKYRGEKKSKGKRMIRRQRYLFQPHDLVVYENKIWKVIGTHNRGASVRITNGQQTFSRSPKKFGTLHFPVYTCWSNEPISRESFFQKCKVLLVSYEGCQKFKHKLHINSLILTQEVAIPPLS